ncbi:hypothetical protein KUCAC02_019443 [Chaenocephalus aceratus]|uniref:Uncharacterized protein n=1 Tax=Chaenocephalus aceratus TaxID=36190 RepID=A0ACB9VP48_CHAAC|nr:hypothetical protein KUCAC02_019443 [Chaenocephalus aceratus]
MYTCTNSPSFPHLDSIKLYCDHPPLNTSYNREVKRGLRGLTEHELEKESQGEEEERVEVRGSLRVALYQPSAASPQQDLALCVYVQKPGTISGLQLELRRTPPARPSYAPTQHGVEEFTLIQ